MNVETEKKVVGNPEVKSPPNAKLMSSHTDEMRYCETVCPCMTMYTPREN